MSQGQDLTTRYRLKQLLNWTGVARTFRGQHPETGAPVAVKLLSLSRSPSSKVLAQRFEASVGVLRGLRHPAFPRVVEAGLTPAGDAYLVTQWIDGTPLPENGEVHAAELLPVVLQVVEALESLSLHGLVHLNIRPANLLVQADGRARIVGWGTSLFTVDWQSSPRHPDEGPLNAYSAPELRAQRHPGDALWRADLYSIALLTARLLGARLTSQGGSFEVRFERGLSEQLNRPENLRELLEISLHQDPELRPDAYSALARAIQHSMPRLGPGPSETQPLETSYLPLGTDFEPLPAGADASASGGENAEVGLETVAFTGLGGLSALAPPVRVRGLDEALRTGAPAPHEAAGSEAALPVLETVAFTPPPPPPLASKAAEPHSQGVPRDERTADDRRVPPLQTAASAGAVPPVAAGPTPSPPVGQAAGETEADLLDVSSTQELPTLVPDALPSPPRSAPAPPAAPPLPTMLPDAPPPSPRVEASAASTSKGSLRRPPSGPPSRATSRPQSSAVAGAPPPPSKAPAGAEPVRRPPSERPRANGSRDEAVRASPKAGAGATLSSRGAARVEAGSATAPKAPASTTEARRLKGPKRTSAGAGGAGMTRLRWVALAAFALLAVVLSISLLRGEARPVIVSDAPTLEPAPLTRSPELEPVEAPRAPPPTSLSEPLQAAVLAVAEGRLIEGRRMLDALRLAAEAGELSPEEQEAYQATRSALLEGRLSEVRDALTADLASANSARLERTLSSLNTEEERRLLAEQRGRGLLERARALLERLRAGDAQLADGSALDALETANRLLGEHPRLERAQVLKEQAAQAVQDRIEAAIEARRLAEARQLVSRLAALWPDRPGLAALRERVEQRIETRQQLESLLDQAQELAQRGRPHRGLELLETVGDVPPDVRSRLAQLRAGLLEMFRSADREPPTLTLLEEQRTFRKGEPIVLDLEAADDYEVQEVTLHVRTAGATAYTPLVAEARGAARYQAVIAPPLHGDKPVEIWLEATDRSGHKTLVGSAEQPVELRRKRWFRGN